MEARTIEIEAEARKVVAGARIETVRSTGFAAGVALTVSLAAVGFGSAVVTGSGIEYGVPAGTVALVGLTLLRRLSSKRDGRA